MHTLQAEGNAYEPTKSSIGKGICSSTMDMTKGVCVLVSNSPSLYYYQALPQVG